MDELRIILPRQVNSILVAVSGGADSVALLALLKEAAAERQVRLTAAHFEHGIRAEDSLADAAFVRDLCARWRVPLLEGSADVPALAKKWGVGLEQAAREARYAFLRDAMRRAEAQVIALGHHLDDQAETVMMHLLRGSGLQGVAGMRESEGDLYRPLLKIRKKTLVSYLEEEGIEWREDATNREPDNPRNGLRLRVLPEAERFYPGANRAISRFSEIAAAENDYMNRQTDRILFERCARVPGGFLLRMQEGDSIHPALIMRALHRLTALPYDAVRLAADAAGRARARADLKMGWTAERGREGLYLTDGSWRGLSARELPDAGEARLGELGCVTVETGRGVPVRDDPFTQELDRNALKGACIRTRLPGDRIRPLGVNGRQKLKEYFIDRHVDRAMRDYIPLLAKGNDVLWVMGLGISEEAKLKEGGDPVRISLTGWPLEMNGGNDDA